jgi:hypothetical protein
MTITREKDKIMTYISSNNLTQVLTQGGMSSVYTVDFTKENGDERTITGVLVKPIDGPLGTNVALMTDEGYKSFNTGRVVSITKENT